MYIKKKILNRKKKKCLKLDPNSLLLLAVLMTQQTAAWQKRAFVAKQVLGADTMLVKPAGWGRYKSTENHVKEKWLAFSSRNKIGSIAKKKKKQRKKWAV